VGRSALLVTALLMPLYPPGAVAETGAAEQLASYVWLDVERQPLPFQDHASIREALSTGEVIESGLIGQGVGGARKLVLESGGTRFHAVFRSIDLKVRARKNKKARKATKPYRDAAVFELAAYEISQLLGIHRIPPTVARRIGGQDGTVQIWMEATITEFDLVEQQRLKPPDVYRYRQQKQIMFLLDNLIGNRDRNQGNLLIDETWNVWLIDHTRSFDRSRRLRHPERSKQCERRLWLTLQELDEETLRQRVAPYLERLEVGSLLRRRKKLIRHFKSLIKMRGEDAILFDIHHPTGERLNVEAVVGAGPRPALVLRCGDCGVTGVPIR